MGSYSYKKHKKIKYTKKSKYSKKNKNYKGKKTRKMCGGGMGVVVESGSPDRYINPTSNSQIIGCRSDNTTGAGAYYLNTPLAVKGQNGGGQVCTQSPYQFLQKGGSKKRSRHMKGGDGSFWNFAKFWNPNQPEQGGNVLALSNNGTSPAGIGAPISTAGDKPIPVIQPWPAQRLIMPHDYTKGGAQVGGGRKKGKGRSRKGKMIRGGGILEDVQNIGRSVAYGFGSVVNGLSGYSNQIYNTNPNPTVQFPNGLGDSVLKQYKYTDAGLKDVYDKAYAKSASM
jgi:hypothetical protein